MNGISVITKTQRRNKPFKEEFIQTMDRNHYIILSSNGMYGLYGIKLKDNIKYQYMNILNQKHTSLSELKIYDIDEIKHDMIKEVYKKYYNHNNNILPFSFSDRNMNRMIFFDPLHTFDRFTRDMNLDNLLPNNILIDAKLAYDAYSNTEKYIFNDYLSNVLKLLDSIGLDRKYIYLQYENNNMIISYLEKHNPNIQDDDFKYVSLAYLSFYQIQNIGATRKYDPPKEIDNIENVFEFNEYKFFKKYREYTTIICRIIIQCFNNDDFITSINNINNKSKFPDESMILFSRHNIVTDIDKLIDKILPLEISEIVIEPDMIIPHTTNKKIKIKKETIIPHIANIIINFDSITYSLLNSCFVIHANFDRTKTLVLNPNISPVVITILPQFNKKEIIDCIPKISSIISNVTNRFIVDDSLDDISGKYIKSDEIGALFAITIDYVTCNDGTIAIRNRKDRKHIRLSIHDLNEYLSNYLL